MRKKILLVDDDESILMLYSEALEHYRYKTAALPSTKDLLQIVIDEQPDLVIMDIWIPGMGGEAAAEMLKNNESTFNIPILFVSANANADVIATKVGAEGYLNKPFELEDFIHKIEEVLQVKSYN